MLRKKLESEGNAKNLETYLRMHKEIIVPKEFMDKEIERVSPFEPTKKGSFFLKSENLDVKVLYYIDNMDNLARVKIDLNKIDTTKKDLESPAKSNDMYLKIQKGLENLGFESGLLFSQSRNQEREIDLIIKRYEDSIKSAKQEEAKKEFNF